MNKQLMDVDEFSTLLQPLRENFVIKNHQGQEATEELLNTIVWWECHPEIYESLEEILNKKFILE
jgi:hypothetical protein